MGAVEVKRTNVKSIKVRTQAMGNRVSVSHFLWMAKELEKAVDEGMPTDTEVRVDNPTGVNGVTLSAQASLVQEIP